MAKINPNYISSADSVFISKDKLDSTKGIIGQWEGYPC